MSNFSFLNWISCGWWNGGWENSVASDPSCLDLNGNGICDYLETHTQCTDLDNNGICDIYESTSLWDDDSCNTYSWDDDINCSGYSWDD